MERNCLRTVYRTSLKTMNTSTIGGGANNNPSNNATVKSQKNKLCRATTTEEDFINGISWPPRSYMCNFCKREFRSAQALGGHMNVHRRDRALLYSPQNDGQFTNLNLNLLHNPNPNILPSNNDVAFLGRKASGLKTAEIAKPNNNNVFERGHWKKDEKFNIGLDIEMSTTNNTTSSTNVLNDAKKDIDLELRLGYST